MFALACELRCHRFFVQSSCCLCLLPLSFSRPVCQPVSLPVSSVWLPVFFVLPVPFFCFLFVGCPFSLLFFCQGDASKHMLVVIGAAIYDMATVQFSISTLALRMMAGAGLLAYPEGMS